MCKCIAAPFFCMKSLFYAARAMSTRKTTLVVMPNKPAFVP